ncbi:hypothetical protein [Clostridium thermarum]|nr:hypothetical protein [Clostridium thermarum]
MVEELTGYKKKMAMLGFRMIEEDKKNQAVNNSNVNDKKLQSKANNTEFK